MVITGKHILHSAFYLAVTLLCVAIYFIMLRAQYLAAVQILVYIGSVIVLIIFALMLTRTNVGDSTNISNNQKVFAALIAMVLFVSLAIVFSYSKINVVAENSAGIKIVSMKEFASILFSKYTLPFEVASVLLLAALVGSVVLAMKEKREVEGEVTEGESAEKNSAGIAKAEGTGNPGLNDKNDESGHAKKELGEVDE